eukprot:ANDGO_01026.mRNA.1 DNA polymerase delta catalytic subunit
MSTKRENDSPSEPGAKVARIAPAFDDDDFLLDEDFAYEPQQHSQASQNAAGFPPVAAQATSKSLSITTNYSAKTSATSANSALPNPSSAAKKPGFHSGSGGHPSSSAKPSNPSNSYGSKNGSQEKKPFVPRKRRNDDDDDVGDFGDEDEDNDVDDIGIDFEDDMMEEGEGSVLDETAFGDRARSRYDDLMKQLAPIRDANDEEELDRRFAWMRPPLTKVSDPSEESISFMQVDMDYTVGPALDDVPLFVDHKKPGKRKQVPIVRMFGITKTGMSVLAHIYGFEPYFYIESPQGFSDSEMATLVRILNNYLMKKDSKNDPDNLPVLRVEAESKQSIMYYRFGAQHTFLRITTSLPKFVPECKSALAKGFEFPGRGPLQFTTYESDVLFILRFMIDTDVVGGNWIELPAGKYLYSGDNSRTVSQKMRSMFTSASMSDWKLPPRTSVSQFEVWAHYRDFISHAPVGEWARIAPLRVFSFDIECAGRKGVFPEPEHDPVIQIATVVNHYGITSVSSTAAVASEDEDDAPDRLANKYRPTVIRTVFTLGTCAPIVGSDVIPCKTEVELLSRWREFFTLVDPDFVIGYNIANFDLPYLLDRADKLGLKNFAHLSRIVGLLSKAKDTRFSSAAYGTRESKEVSMPARVTFDVMQAVQRDYKLSSYSLNAVSSHFLGEQKEDVHHSIISELQEGNEDTRRRLAVYCLKDALLPLRILERLMMVPNYLEMARVTGVPLGFLLSRGQQIKVISQLLRKTKTRNIIMPTYSRKAETSETYEGATVIEPKKGFYEKPIATLDFASLYPSIMMAHNLCYTTLVRPSDVSKLSSVDEKLREQEWARTRSDADGALDEVSADPIAYRKTPNGDVFVSAKLQKGILPEILEELLAARKRAKQDLAKSTDPFEKAVLDGRQLALKVSANSVYGFTGATVGKLPCLEISSSVTAFGREMINLTKQTVESEFPGAEVVYGDTDSVMVSFPVGQDEVAKAMELGRIAAKTITSKFQRPISLEFEKVYFPFLLISKKRYAGLLWTKPDKYDKMDFKGLEVVRRDNCLLVRQVVDTVLRKILIERSPEGAKSYVKSIISDLLRNKMDISMLVITKALSKSGSDYAAKQAHVELAERMRKRDAGTAPHIGDRVPYVIIKGAKGAKAYEKAEDPIYVLENNIPIDTQHYLEHQLSLPLTRIFEGIMSRPESLFSGEHTRAISISTPSVGGIMKFAKKTMSCLGCRTPLPADQQDKALCVHCQAKEPDIYQKNLTELCDLEQQFGKLWTECQRCQGALHLDVLCTNRDCPIFYMRKKVAKDLKDMQDTVDRFGW